MLLYKYDNQKVIVNIFINSKYSKNIIKGVTIYDYNECSVKMDLNLSFMLRFLLASAKA